MTDNNKWMLGRFKTRSTITKDNHWLWNGAVNKGGHGLVTVNRKQIYLHRYIFCLANNLSYDDSSFFACHKQECNIPNCWNPEHIYKGNSSSNTKDAVTTGRNHEISKTHCPRGHILFERAKNGKRFCRECNRLRDRARERITINGKRYTIPGTRTIL